MNTFISIEIINKMKQTILVTGGAGYIGSWIVKLLIEQGNTVRVSVRDKSKTEKYQHILDLEKTNDDFSGRQLEVFKIYTRLNRINQHKMIPIPICEIPNNLQ